MKNNNRCYIKDEEKKYFDIAKNRIDSTTVNNNKIFSKITKRVIINNG
jgi:hypothetical protein